MARPPRRTRFTERARPFRETARREGDDEATGGGWTNPAVIVALVGLVASAAFSIHMLSNYTPGTAAPSPAADATAGAITDTLGLTETLGTTETLDAAPIVSDTLGAAAAITATGALSDAPGAAPDLAPGGAVTGTSGTTDTVAPAKP